MQYKYNNPLCHHLPLFFTHSTNQATTKQQNLPQQQPPPTQTTTTMSFFKSPKNQSASAASTPAQTPRTSVDGARPVQPTKMTREQAVQIAMEKSLGATRSAIFHGNIRM
ncbi:hypothetical protein EMPS_05885 [Entomortierella parvispora]|uniref:Uncharacterized protein n=1 Tax=Entomortierella parvispora TaxID=205924 RepID=A0A9P3HBD7_9FUNG|nr:hypothetical protein EMPS_05885 [Entomortierella parvispora]